MNLEICNMTLSHINAKAIGDESENSKEANSLRKFYDIAYQIVLRDFNWPFATKIAPLGLVEEAPNDEWGYSYRYPSDCLDARRIISVTRYDAKEEKIPFKIGKDDGGKLIFCDIETAELEYTEMVDDSNIITPDFKLAFSFKLAHLVAPELTGGDPFKLGDRAKENYIEQISNAKANAGNEEQPDNEPNSCFERAR